MDDNELQNLLLTSIQHGNDSLLDDLLSGNEAAKLINLPGQDGNMLLHCAVLENKLKCVECLLKHGANPNVFDTVRARSPLHLAIELGYGDIVRAFLDLEHINLELRDDRNLSCLEVAQFCDRHDLAELIRDRQAELTQSKIDFHSVINQACSSNQPDLVRDLIGAQEKRILTRLAVRGRIPIKDAKLIARKGVQELLNWTSSSWNDVTLLFKAASNGYSDICAILIEYGANAKCNENTNYSPLYVAAYGGFTETVRLLLDNFPSLIAETTIEKWTILHACCLQGHSKTAKLILNYTYPDYLKRRYVNRLSQYEYDFAFDLNAQDAAGQTVIYLAVSANNENLLDTLLQFNVKARLLKTIPEKSANISNKAKLLSGAQIVPDRPKLLVDSSDSQVDKIIQQLRGHDLGSKGYSFKGQSGQKANTIPSEYMICPFDLDTYCDYNSKTALHLAVMRQDHKIATCLLVNGSDPNLTILTRDTSSVGDPNGSGEPSLTSWLRETKSTCLREACERGDETMVEILIRYGAKDQYNLALQVAVRSGNTKLISKLLALHSIVDLEYKINNSCNVEFAARYRQTNVASSQQGSLTTFSSMFPSIPVAIDWQNLKSIKEIEPQWLIDASLYHNKRLKHPTTSLMAITRLDLSSNNIKSVNSAIFRLPSLRELNLSKNRLESLIEYNGRHRGSIESPTMKLIESHKTAMKRSKSSQLYSCNLESSNIIDLNEPQSWDLPYLETLDLHDNRLMSLPESIFELPKLRELDISLNQIRQLPSALWSAPSLKELIASGNLLDDLPKLPSAASPKNGKSLDQSEASFADDKSTSSANELDERAFLLELDVYTEHQLDSISQPLSHINHWKRTTDIVATSSSLAAIRSASFEADQSKSSQANKCKISSLNLSHNSFSQIPEVLACVATELTRLNLNSNRFVALGDISLYPASLKTLDLSSNQVSSWFKFRTQRDCLICYSWQTLESPSDNSSFDDIIECPHKLHTRLDQLKSLNLNQNMLPDIQLGPRTITDLSKLQTSSRSPLEAAKAASGFITDQKSAKHREQLFFPNITVLDLSCNKIQQVPKQISDLKDLSVLNLSGNYHISSLPPELGLSSKLWNLGINACNLSEPLKSMLESKTYKTVDIIGYLRSILEEAKPFVRMKLMLVGLQGIGKTSLLEQMREEGSSGLRRRLPEHWTKRMGHASKSNLRNQKGVTLSTVGVDIHDWSYCKKTARNQKSFGPVSFSTWDFGGQEEFYATHRYFLSKRSVYLVVWRLSDGLEGISSIQQWLVNVQSRAPGSPVVIVGTHEDMVQGGLNGEIVQRLNAEVHKRFIDVSDHDKCGLPRVMDSIIVSTKTRLNIKHLCDRIYDIVFSLKTPGSNERLLEQKIPATYLYLEEIVNSIVLDRHQKRLEPVLNYEEYRKLASEQLLSKHNKVFRDLEPPQSRDINYNSELQQATRFLHENGILLHYEDANLRDLYFLDPQWLCDILSHVVTIREINPYVKNGLMRIDELGFLFKSIDVNFGGGVQSYVVNLLNKFEVALTWNSQYLLIPSLLPESCESIDSQYDGFQVKVAPRARGRSAVRRYEPSRAAKRAASIEPTRLMNNLAGPAAQETSSGGYKVELDRQPTRSIHRLVLLRYLPAGFVARLQSAILSDLSFEDICCDLHSNLVLEANGDIKLNGSIGNFAGWTCWKRGVRLSLQHESTINSSSSTSSDEQPNALTVPLLLIRQLDQVPPSPLGGAKFMIENVHTSRTSSPDCVEQNQQQQQSGVEVLKRKWCELNISEYTSILMISVERWRLKITNRANQSVQFIEPDQQMAAQLLAKAVDHIDDLLEDWYPSLGTRFAHTLGGSYLVTRIVPCLSCLSEFNESHRDDASRPSRSSARSSRQPASRANFSISSVNSVRDDSQSRGWRGQPADISHKSGQLQPPAAAATSDIYSYYVENCILNAYSLESLEDDSSLPAQARLLNSKLSGLAKKCKSGLKCPKHGRIRLGQAAPDIVFDDLAQSHRIEGDQIERCKLAGRGTFGFVFKATLRSVVFPLNQLSQANQDIALKVLQPVDPGPEASQADVAAYKSIKSNWEREPFQCACKSYCAARHEVNILRFIRHPNIVPFLGICTKPLAIVLELAPLGSLADVFKTFKRSGMRLDECSAQKTILQIARALEFLHQQRIIYRDLKAENILVWSFPTPFATRPREASVELKLADYGISRQALSTGIWKGFAGTINFLAPEILRHNGDEEYTEKVDCFSFGILMYEMLTMRPPFKHSESLRNHLSVDSTSRPALTNRDLAYPSHMLDLMSICWSHDPHLRPTASQIVSLASTPEFMQLMDAIALTKVYSHKRQATVSACVLAHSDPSGECTLDLWLAREPSQIDVLSSQNSAKWADYRTFSINANSYHHSFEPTAICSSSITNRIWLVDATMTLHLVPARPIRNRAQLNNRSSTLASSKTARASSSTNCIANSEASVRIQSFPIDLTGLKFPKDCHVSQMKCADSINCLVMLLNVGQLWLLDLASLKLTQLGDTNIKLKCMAKISQLGGDNGLFQIVCGHANAISWFDVVSSSGHLQFKQNIVPLASKSTRDLSGEQIVDSSQSSDVTSIEVGESLLWTAAGGTVHLWDIKERCVARKLDCWKLVPCSESLESINIEVYYQEARTSVVSSLAFYNKQLFVGSSHGCLMVVEATTLKPIIVFRPYERNLRILVPNVVPTVGSKEASDDETIDTTQIVTLGNGYRDLMRRYISNIDDYEPANKDREVAILWATDFSTN